MRNKMKAKATKLKSDLSCKEGTFRTPPTAVSANAASKCEKTIRKRVYQPAPETEGITEIEAKVDVGGKYLVYSRQGRGTQMGQGNPAELL